MFGVSVEGLMSNTGAPWLLMSDEPVKHKDVFKQVTPHALVVLQQGFTKLENWVDAENEVAIRWLKKIGFTFDKDPVPYGVSGDPFYRFEWRRS